MPPSARWSCPILLTSTRSPPGMICWGRQNVNRACTSRELQVNHFVDLTGMVRTMPVASPPWCAALKFFEPVALFRRPEGGSPSKIFSPRNILGLPNPHRGRRRGAVPYRRRGSSGRPPVAGGGLWLIRQGGGSAQGVPRDGSRAARRRRKGAGGIDKASYSLLSLSPKPKALSR